MIKKLLFLFMVFSYVTTQVYAANCAVDCALPQKVEKVQAKGHECCHGKDSKPKKKENMICFHDAAAADVTKSYDLPKVVELAHIYEQPVIELVSKVSVEYSYRQRVPDDGFIRYKSNIDLYILKDQFLI